MLVSASVGSSLPVVPQLAGLAGPSFAPHVVLPLAEPTPNVVERRIAPGVPEPFVTPHHGLRV